jgi:acyl-CoA thioester hydrolase
VPFYETDAMGIVHHANYLNYLELARVAYLDEHDRPYRAYMADGLHFATTRVEIEYRRPLRFDDVVEVEVWLDGLRGASLRMAYALRCRGALVAAAATEHALIDARGRPQRLRGRFSR